jgi:hypothetical protein
MVISKTSVSTPTWPSADAKSEQGLQGSSATSEEAQTGCTPSVNEVVQQLISRIIVWLQKSYIRIGKLLLWWPRRDQHKAWEQLGDSRTLVTSTKKWNQQIPRNLRKYLEWLYDSHHSGPNGQPFGSPKRTRSSISKLGSISAVRVFARYVLEAAM